MGTDGLTDGEKDMAKLIVAFRNFSNAHKNPQYLRHAGSYRQNVKLL